MSVCVHLFIYIVLLRTCSNDTRNNRKSVVQCDFLKSYSIGRNRYLLDLVIVVSGEFLLFAENLEAKMRWLKNYERVQEIQQQIVWRPITELEPRAFIPEVRKTMTQNKTNF